MPNILDGKVTKERRIVVFLLPRMFSNSKSTIDKSEHAGRNGTSTFAGDKQVERVQRGDSGSAARFFYCAKASKSERGESNNHPTVKPIKLMQYLCRLITPPNGIVLDPFAGSGSTCIAAMREGFQFIGLELSSDYCEIAQKRVDAELAQTKLDF